MQPTPALPKLAVTGVSAESHIDALDGIRGIAILLVLLSHGVAFLEAVPANAPLHFLIFGWCGVDLFFVLSGFLITGVLIRSRNAPNRAQSFYARRMLRIFPIYYATLIILFTAPVFLPPLRPLLGLSNWPEYAMFFTFLQNWSALWNQAIVLHSIVGHFWSLAVEEQFYLLWPLLVWKLKPRLLFPACVGGAACALILRIALVSHFGAHYWIQPLTPTRGEGLLIGAALAAFSASYGRPPARLLKTAAAAGFALLLVVLMLDIAEFVNTDAGPYMYTIGITALALIFGALVGSAQFQTSPLTPLLTAKWLRNFGKYSYGIYVYHVPVYLLLTRAAAARLGVNFPLSAFPWFLCLLLLVGVSYALAWCSFEFFESRFLALKSRFRPREHLAELG